ncbi:MAG: WYL domain-containing transcriptional regulator [Lachnospiraceae bacterium]|nr:WYL domain-containing transcriptional regulator [Lachnospiraceae bacterium]
MAGPNQKMKILYLLQILRERTDENHIMSATDLSNALKEYGISAERKSIYSDIEALQSFGVYIVQKKGSTPGYYIASREFEIAELKLLVDAAQASKFITKKKTEELIKKLEGLTSKYEAHQLQRDVYIYNRTKAQNETIFYNVDYIHDAMFSNVQIQFQYSEWTVKKELKLKKGGEFYVVSPWALTWADENYYLIAYDEKADMIKHYRVDKMQRMELLEEARLGKERFHEFDLAAFAKKTFGMYGGEDAKVTLYGKNGLAGVVIDRFGQDVFMMPVDEEHFRAVVTVSVSQQFFGWVTGLGTGIQIAGPEHVREKYQEYLKGLLENY